MSIGQININSKDKPLIRRSLSKKNLFLKIHSLKQFINEKRFLLLANQATKINLNNTVFMYKNLNNTNISHRMRNFQDKVIIKL